MIEVLIAIVIVAIGLLGIAGLQTALTRFNNSSYNRNVAATLAFDMSERIRAYRGNSSDLFPVNADAGTTSTCLQTGGCDRAAMAAHEYASWLQEVSRQLPKGRAIACTDSNLDDEDGSSPTDTRCTNDAGDMQWVIKVWWDDDQDGQLNRFLLVY